MKIGPIALDCASVTVPDAGAVDCIARIRVAASERGRGVRLDNASPQLRELIEFCGLAGALGLDGVDVERETE